MKRFIKTIKERIGRRLGISVVYIVESGAYEQKLVVDVFLKEEDAKKSDASVKNWELIDTSPRTWQDASRGKTVYDIYEGSTITEFKLK